MKITAAFYLILITALASVTSHAANKSVWQKGKDGEFFVQKTLRIDNFANPNLTKIHVKIKKDWQTYKPTKLPTKFLDWNLNLRKKIIENMLHGIHPKTIFGQPHFGVVATYGTKRKDDQIMVNNAVKGIGFLPIKNKLPFFITLLKSTKHRKKSYKLKMLKKIYKNYASSFDSTKLVSLELYTTPQHETKTFLNQINTPFSSIIFLSIPTYQIKTIAYLLSPHNPNLTSYEKKIVEYVNLMHQYFHGGEKFYPVVIYNVIEVYNSTPSDPINGEGKKLN